MNPDTKRFYPTDADHEGLRSLTDPRPVDATVAMRQVQIQPDWTRYEVGETLTLTRVRPRAIPVTREVVIKAITEELLVCKPAVDFAIGTKVQIKDEVFRVEQKKAGVTALRPVGQKPASP